MLLPTQFDEWTIKNDPECGTLKYGTLRYVLLNGTNI